MKSESSIKNFTRGGQTLLHNFRMIEQIFNRVIIFCFIFFIASSIGIAYLFTSEYECYLVCQRVLSYILIFFDDLSKQSFIYPNGKESVVYSQQIMKAVFINAAVHKVSVAIMKGMMFGFLSTMILFCLLYRWLCGRGEGQSQTQQLRGDKIEALKKVSALVKKSKNVSDMKIGDLYLPKNFEVRHLFIHGTAGSGKSVCIRELLDQIRARGDRAIIYDKGCTFMQSYYQEGRDVLLNPFDHRTSSWHLWNECRDAADYDSLAAALMPMPIGSVDPFWINGARTIFAAAARQMQKQEDRSMHNLLKKLLTADLATLENFLRGTEAETLVSEKIEKTAVSIKSVLATNLKSLRYVKDDDKNKAFSIRNWVHDDNQSNWLFISSLSDRHETLKPLISMWLDLAANSLMSLTPSHTRRIWIILDELPTLQKLPYLPECFAESRKFGGCLVAGLQSIAQLRKIYGTNAAEEISGLCNTRLFFRAPSSDTAHWVSKELGQSEIEEVKEGISYGESAMRSGISLSRQQSNRQLVNPSEVMRLNDLEAYVRLPGDFPITKIKLKYKQPSLISAPFVFREMDERNFNEILSENENPTELAAETKKAETNPNERQSTASHQESQSSEINIETKKEITRNETIAVKKTRKSSSKKKEDKKNKPMEEKNETEEENADEIVTAIDV